MLEWLKKPYPFLFESLISRIRVAVFILIFTFLFLVVFEPFDLADVITVNFYIGALLYGLVSGATAFLTGGFLVRVFPNYFTDKGWTVGKEMISLNLMLLSVSLSNGILAYYIELCPIGETKTIWLSLSENLKHTYAVGVFPVLVLTTISYIVKLRRNLAKTAEINLQIDTRLENETPAEHHTKIITIQSSTNNNDFSFCLNDLLFVMSDGNYVEFHIEDEENVRREIRRNTLSNIESQLETFSFLFRSHRAYLVNLNKVIKSSGNAQGYELKFAKTDHTVPVSRRNLSRFDELINS